MITNKQLLEKLAFCDITYVASSFSAIVSNRSTHYEDNFFMFKCLWRSIKYQLTRDAQSTSILTSHHTSIPHQQIMNFVDYFWSSSLNRAIKMFQKKEITIMFVQVRFSILKLFAFQEVMFYRHTKFFSNSFFGKLKLLISISNIVEK